MLYRTGDIVKGSESVYMEHSLVEEAVAIEEIILIIYAKSYNSKTISNQELDDIAKFASKKLTYYMIPKFTYQTDDPENTEWKAE